MRVYSCQDLTCLYNQNIEPKKGMKRLKDYYDDHDYDDFGSATISQKYTPNSTHLCRIFNTFFIMFNTNILIYAIVHLSHMMILHSCVNFEVAEFMFIVHVGLSTVRRLIDSFKVECALRRLPTMWQQCQKMQQLTQFEILTELSRESTK